MENLETLKLLYDIEVEVSVLIGKVVRSIDYVLNIKEGDVIEINKSIDDYLDIYIEDVAFGKGELVVVNDKFSVRLIDLVK